MIVKRIVLKKFLVVVWKRQLLTSQEPSLGDRNIRYNCSKSQLVQRGEYYDPSGWNYVLDKNIKTLRAPIKYMKEVVNTELFKTLK